MFIWKEALWPRDHQGKIKITIGFLDQSNSLHSLRQSIQHIARHWEDAVSGLEFNHSTLSLDVDDDTEHEILRRTVLHEFGHMLGALHEQLSPAFPWDLHKSRIPKDELINWEGSRPPLSKTLWSPFDEKSIMLYPAYQVWLKRPGGPEPKGWERHTHLSHIDKEIMRLAYSGVHGLHGSSTQPWQQQQQQHVPTPAVLVAAPGSGNICGNPQCGRTFVCAADYNRRVQSLGYPGV
ncbi:hypothetical protein DL771_010282 [Monosporascus sp. 5C6A]|nr:hypothetical protein DL771_010282 [Monosporascus sp. 5C6A]